MPQGLDRAPGQAANAEALEDGDRLLIDPSQKRAGG
jgi:hypothetical protein